MKRTVVISDIQYPYHDKRALKNVIGFIGEYQPDEVIQIGDAVDYPQPSRWTKGTRGEFEGSVLKDSEGFVREFSEPLRAVYSGPVGLVEGNHDLRPRDYLTKYAPALAESKHFNFEVLCRFDDFGFRLLPSFHPVGPGWVAAHGHEGFPLSRIAGSTALNAAKRIGKSVVCGHTHRLAVKHETHGYNGKSHSLWGFEVGNLMDMRKADYLKYGGANWAQGFGLLYVGQKDVTAVPVPISSDGSFVVEGERYGALRRTAGGKFAKKEK